MHLTKYLEAYVKKLFYPKEIDFFSFENTEAIQKSLQNFDLINGLIRNLSDHQAALLAISKQQTDPKIVAIWQSVGYNLCLMQKDFELQHTREDVEKEEGGQSSNHGAITAKSNEEQASEQPQIGVENLDSDLPNQSLERLIGYLKKCTLIGQSKVWLATIFLFILPSFVAKWAKNAENTLFEGLKKAENTRFIRLIAQHSWLKFMAQALVTPIFLLLIAPLFKQIRSIKNIMEQGQELTDFDDDDLC